MSFRFHAWHKDSGNIMTTTISKNNVRYSTLLYLHPHVVTSFFQTLLLLLLLCDRLNLISHNRTIYNNTNNIHEIVGQKTKYDELVDSVLVLASIREFLYHYNRPKVRRYCTRQYNLVNLQAKKKIFLIFLLKFWVWCSGDRKKPELLWPFHHMWLDRITHRMFAHDFFMRSTYCT